ncbi:hypothetical protein [Pontibacillus marinus]|uniref:Uncharacterized protein n=1 Tax=Pontibacillus marinus BH030004 = DSM 16465 TaxID=1385511 RepID=A0A0A5G2Z0_9BACI|nr:hypothetical protein [Pontibacillus marinus]KGX85445.1 hypothetical protein N783_14755 [Pontibacillus marinus BH030004 = DSM 16465]
MKWIPIFWLVMTVLAFLFNLLGMMRLVPFILSMPILFVTIYFTIFSFTHRKSFRGLR